mmetsp:Transcript_29956/g.64770  ORF Transcript_29956/g.64770 Transcript_29956/m.64770 type:complete len:270 (-) Transcript_29956:243-1052(-)|eukprot:CAMPEP_0206420864 /NCGR_PEP_ID=MMETSP0324_2-20121206/1122_1 /ASSEMBLY_ACC=CAM_ASM_000836 /TAXON_ID=2866 /ORGANISM="Crypthecodinium cohnii, Strain Seligo" /LENGTH=269 /DNA_ID=CAMNT_0053884881 /DNA_START=58 /DNA_END=867 /DNA_ORIENTATION=+
MAKAKQRSSRKTAPKRKPRGDKQEKIEELPPVALLDDMGECTPAFKRALVQLFARFDEDRDRLLNEEELKKYSLVCNGEGNGFSEEELNDIKEFFDWKDSPEGTGLTLRGWLQLYMTQTQGREDDTWEDLTKMGYDSQLKLRTPYSLKAEGELKAKLEELIKLGEEGKLVEFIDAFVMSDVDQEDRDAFRDRLSGVGAEEGSSPDDPGQILGLLAELRCCLTGTNVTKVEGDLEDGPLEFTFDSPAPGLEMVERGVVFVKEDGRWCVEG